MKFWVFSFLLLLLLILSSSILLSVMPWTWSWSWSWSWSRSRSRSRSWTGIWSWSLLLFFQVREKREDYYYDYGNYGDDGETVELPASDRVTQQGICSPCSSAVRGNITLPRYLFMYLITSL